MVMKFRLFSFKVNVPFVEGTPFKQMFYAGNQKEKKMWGLSSYYTKVMFRDINETRVAALPSHPNFRLQKILKKGKGKKGMKIGREDNRKVGGGKWEE